MNLSRRQDVRTDANGYESEREEKKKKREREKNVACATLTRSPRMGEVRQRSARTIREKQEINRFMA